MIFSYILMVFINEKRLRDYPRLMLFTVWMVLLINLTFHQGWIGAFGQLIGVDFLTFYSAGQIYRTNPDLIYDAATQMDVQQSVIRPTELVGYGPYMNPPYVAPLYSLWTDITYPWAFALWTMLALLSIFISIRILTKIIPFDDCFPTFTYTSLIILTLSFFPFIEGIQAGQNHWITLLLLSAISFTMIKEKWYLSGFLTGLLIYKPQFIVGFLVLWLIWKNFKALLTFVLVAITWIGLYTLQNGVYSLLVYTKLSQEFLSLPYTPGFPRYILVTIYGFLTSLFPQSTQLFLSTLTTILIIFGGVGLAWLAYRLRSFNVHRKIPAIIAAMIFPLLLTPYALLHDLIILIPALVLCYIYQPNSKPLIHVAILVYFGAFFLTLFGAVTNLAWVSLLVITISVIFIYWVITKRNFIFAG